MGERYLITLKVQNLRGHTNTPFNDDFEPDLRAMFLNVDKTYVIPGSSIKGVTRKKALLLSSPGDEEFAEVFGRPGTRQGRVSFGWGYLTRTTLLCKRYGVAIDRELGVAESDKLYIFEYLPGTVELRFEVHVLYPLSEGAKRLLSRSLSLLKYDTIGWGGSRGIGVVEEVMLDDRLVTH